MSFKLRSTDCSAKRIGSIIEERSIRRGIYFPLCSSQPLVLREGEDEEGREEPEEEEDEDKGFRAVCSTKLPPMARAASAGERRLLLLLLLGAAVESAGARLVTLPR